jgi:glycerol-1-phosphate dehydrogenase [NAD(P)+]
VPAPEVFVFEANDSEDDAAKELTRLVVEKGFSAPLPVASIHGGRLASQLNGLDVVQPGDGADQAWAAATGSRALRSGADVVVAIGGGRCLDVGKLAASRAGLPLISVPTQLSHDGICSPVAVVPGSDGRAQSIGAVEPRAVFLSIPTIASAPVASVAAGLGDMIANPLALRDWALAAERGLEEVDERAWTLSVESFRMIEPFLDIDPETSSKDPRFLRVLADALILSGLAMIHSGTSRPASGGEHEISHAMDQLHGGLAHHGAQVAFGSIISVALYGEDTTAFRARLRTLRLPDHPRTLGLDTEGVVRILMEAPNTRPGRFTILEHADLDETKARKLIETVWGDD